MNLTLNQFWRFASYSNLFDFISLVNYPELEQAIKADEDYDKLFVIDSNHNLWPKLSFEDEQIRVAKINRICTKPQLITSPSITIEQLKELLSKAKADKDVMKCMEIQLNIYKLVQEQNKKGIDYLKKKGTECQSQ